MVLRLLGNNCSDKSLSKNDVLCTDLRCFPTSSNKTLCSDFNSKKWIDTLLADLQLITPPNLDLLHTDKSGQII